MGCNNSVIEARLHKLEQQQTQALYRMGQQQEQALHKMGQQQEQMLSRIGGLSKSGSITRTSLSKSSTTRSRKNRDAFSSQDSKDSNSTRVSSVTELEVPQVRDEAYSSPVTQVRDEGSYDVFVSHAKKMMASEDRAVWVADVCEAHGLLPFFDRTDLVEISEQALKEKMMKSSVCVTVLDPLTFHSVWVYKENLWAAEAGIPILPIYDADRFRWDGQLAKWQQMYPWIFLRRVVPLTKTQRRTTIQVLLEAIDSAIAEGRRPPAQPILEPQFHFQMVQTKVGVGGSRETETRSAIETAHNTMMAKLDGGQPSLIVAAFTCTHDAQTVAEVVHELSPSVPILGCTSCQGIVLNDSWLTYQKQFALALWAVSDDAGAYTVIHITERSDDFPYVVRHKVRKACALTEEQPSFAILLGSPGDEEIILESMRSALGEGVPIIGGSSGDNQVLGAWRQIAVAGSSNLLVKEPTVSENGITIAIGWSSCQVATTLTSGFRTTDHKGKVTKVDETDHGRTIVEIDGKPANQVYDSWTKGEVTRGIEWKDGAATILGPSSFMPLGQPCSADYVRVLHPAFVNSSKGTLTTFADAWEGMDVVGLSAAPETLAKKISQSARTLLADESLKGKDDAFLQNECIGALMIFCGGLVMAIDDKMPIAAEQLATCVGHNNTMGICCFGEQGMNHEQKVIHGNLMFGCLLFSNRPQQKSGYLPNAENQEAFTKKLSLNSIRPDRRHSFKEKQLQYVSKRSDLEPNPDPPEVQAHQITNL